MDKAASKLEKSKQKLTNGICNEADQDQYQAPILQFYSPGFYYGLLLKSGFNRVSKFVEFPFIC